MASKPTDKRRHGSEARSDTAARRSDGRSDDELAERRARFVEGVQAAAAERQLEAVAPWLARLQDENPVARFARWRAEHGDDPSSLERLATLSRADQLVLMVLQAANALADSTAPDDVVQRAKKHVEMVYDIIENRRRGKDGRSETELWLAIVEGVEAIALRMEQASMMEPPLTCSECAEWVPAAVGKHVTSVDLIRRLETNLEAIAVALAAWLEEPDAPKQWDAVRDLAICCGVQVPSADSMKEGYSRHRKRREAARVQVDFRARH